MEIVESEQDRGYSLNVKISPTALASLDAVYSSELDAWIITRLFIPASSRNQGIGTALLNQMKRHFAGKSIMVEPGGYDSDRGQQLKFYMDRGFKRNKIDVLEWDGFPPVAIRVGPGMPHDVECTRPSVWGNPFKIGQDGTRHEVCQKYALHLKANPALIKRARRELSGRRLRCVCKLSQECHVDILVLIVNGWRGLGA